VPVRELASEPHWPPFDRSIDVQISRLCHKLREDIKEPKLIRTIRGEGYMLDAKQH
jgi:two-component system OmpR family response regulator